MQKSPNAQYSEYIPLIFVKSVQLLSILNVKIFHMTPTSQNSSALYCPFIFIYQMYLVLAVVSTVLSKSQKAAFCTVFPVTVGYSVQY